MTQQFGQALRELRQQAGIGLSELARRSGIARSHLYRLESGETSEPNTDTLNALAPALGIDAEHLHELAWQTTGTGPGLPSLPTYLRTKLGLNDNQIAAMERTLKRITTPKTKPTPAAPPTNQPQRSKGDPR